MASSVSINVPGASPVSINDLWSGGRRRGAVRRCEQRHTQGTAFGGHAATGSTSKGARSWRLTRRGRAALWIVVGITAISLLGISQVATAPGITGASQQTLTSVPESQRAGSVVVRPGDSLWTIAERELGYMDPREAVVELRKLNGVTGGELVAGQRLALPVR